MDLTTVYLTEGRHCVIAYFILYRGPKWVEWEVKQINPDSVLVNETHFGARTCFASLNNILLFFLSCFALFLCLTVLLNCVKKLHAGLLVGTLFNKTLFNKTLFLFFSFFLFFLVVVVQYKPDNESCVFWMKLNWTGSTVVKPRFSHFVFICIMWAVMKAEKTTLECFYLIKLENSCLHTH